MPVYCDVVRSVQIVSNLISNATKYSPDDASIVVRVLPINKPAASGRALARGAADAERKKIPINVNAEIENDFGSPDGFARAADDLAAVVARVIG